MSDQGDDAKSQPDVPQPRAANKSKSRLMRAKSKTTATKGAKESRKKSAARKVARGAPVKKGASARVAYPKHNLASCIRIPQGIIDQNAGNQCSDKEAAKFAKIGWSGEVGVEISSAIKYGLLERPAAGQLKPTDLARKVIRPQHASDKLDGLRDAVLKAPIISDLYKRYRGENLPEEQFLINTAVDSYAVPRDRVEEFVKIFVQTLRDAELVEDLPAGKSRVLDIVTNGASIASLGEEQIKKLSKGLDVSATDTCFVMMPFADPIGGYYSSLYQPAIEKARLTAIRADADIFGTGKIVDQIWSGINSARILVAELTGRNPNVLYELGIAHALRKPVVLVSANEQDVPFDVRHVRVIYYDVRDPFWGTKLIEKVAENILSALRQPNEAILFNS